MYLARNKVRLIILFVVIAKVFNHLLELFDLISLHVTHFFDLILIVLLLLHNATMIALRLVI